MRTLAELGFLNGRNGEYDLSLAVIDHGTYVRTETTFGDVIQQFLERLADETGETVWYIGEERGEMRTLYPFAANPRPVSIAPVKSSATTNAFIMRIPQPVPIQNDCLERPPRCRYLRGAAR